LLAGTYSAYPERDGQAELTWVALAEIVSPRTVTHRSVDPTGPDKQLGLTLASYQYYELLIIIAYAKTVHDC